MRLQLFTESHFQICSLKIRFNISGRIDYVATPDFWRDFQHISVEAATGWQTKCFSSDSDRRGLTTRTPSSGTRFQASCSRLDRVQSVMPSRVHHGGASAEQKASSCVLLTHPSTRLLAQQQTVLENSTPQCSVGSGRVYIEKQVSPAEEATQSGGW